MRKIEASATLDMDELITVWIVELVIGGKYENHFFDDIDVATQFILGTLKVTQNVGISMHNSIWPRKDYLDKINTSDS